MPPAGIRPSEYLRPRPTGVPLLLLPCQRHHRRRPVRDIPVSGSEAAEGKRSCSAFLLLPLELCCNASASSPICDDVLHEPALSRAMIVSIMTEIEHGCLRRSRPISIARQGKSAKSLRTCGIASSRRASPASTTAQRCRAARAPALHRQQRALQPAADC